MMMAWDFDESGKFGSEKAAENYARRTDLKDADFRTRGKGTRSSSRTAGRRSVAAICATVT